MANIRKTFNFRAGVKVDDSVLVVAGARVGIGSTTPTKTFDVNGNAIFNGQLVSSKLLVSGISTFNDDIEGDGATNISGINSVTATKFYGDASGLNNLPGSQWIDIDVGLGFTSIYAAGNVGVGTTDPRFTMQIGSDPRTVGKNGVGIDGPSGNIKSSGIITATSFDGSLLGAGAVSNSSQTNIKTLGTLTGLDVNGHSELDNLNVTGVSTLGVTTFTGAVSFGSSALFNDNAKIILGAGGTEFQVYHDGSTSIIKSSEGNLNLQTVSGEVILSNSAGEVGVSYKHNDRVEIRHDNTTRFQTSGVGVTVYNQLDTTNLNVSGVGSFGSIGIGTTNPATDFQIVNSENSVITLGRDNTATGNNGAISFGKTTTGFPYSNANSLDIINYGIGNVNFYLEAGTLGATTGDFFWHRRGNYARLMTLTNDGKLGIGVTQPTNQLHVVGASTVTSNAFFGSNVEIKGDLNVSQELTVGSFTVTTLNANVSGTLNGNVNATSGLSTFTKAKVTTSLGINTDAPVNGIALNSGVNKVFVTSGGYIGIKTTSSTFLGVNALNTPVIVGSVGVGTDVLKSSVDFSNAGKIGIVTTNRFMIPPKLTSVERSAIAEVEEGAFIYNTDNNRLEVYAGSSPAWAEVGSGGGGGGGILNVSEDTSPELGGDLDANSKNIENVGILTVGNSTVNLTIQNNATNSMIAHTNSSSSGLYLQSNKRVEITNEDATKVGLRFNNGGNHEVELFHNHVNRLETTGSGVNISGILTTTQIADSDGNVGTASSILSSTGTGLKWVEGGSGTGGTVSSGSFTASAGSPSTLETYAYDSAELVFEYTVFVKNGANYQSQKLLVMRDGTTVTSSAYGIMYSNILLVQLDATISGSNLLLRATPETGVTGSTTYRLRREVT